MSCPPPPESNWWPALGILFRPQIGCGTAGRKWSTRRRATVSCGRRCTGQPTRSVSTWRWSPISPPWTPTRRRPPQRSGKERAMATLHERTVAAVENRRAGGEGSRKDEGGAAGGGGGGGGGGAHPGGGNHGPKNRPRLGTNPRWTNRQ